MEYSFEGSPVHRCLPPPQLPAGRRGPTRTAQRCPAPTPSTDGTLGRGGGRSTGTRPRGTPSRLFERAGQLTNMCSIELTINSSEQGKRHSTHHCQTWTSGGGAPPHLQRPPNTENSSRASTASPRQPNRKERHTPVGGEPCQMVWEAAVNRAESANPLCLCRGGSVLEEETEAVKAKRPTYG